MHFVAKLILAIALLCTMESALAECTDCESYKDIKEGCVLITHYMISINNYTKVAAIWLENTDKYVRNVECWRVAIGGEVHPFGKFNLDQGEMAYAVWAIEKTITEGDAITVTDNNGKVVQSIPLPEVSQGGLCDSYRSNNGVWKIYPASWGYSLDC